MKTHNHHPSISELILNQPHLNIAHQVFQAARLLVPLILAIRCLLSTPEDRQRQLPRLHIHQQADGGRRPSDPSSSACECATDGENSIMNCYNALTSKCSNV